MVTITNPDAVDWAGYVNSNPDLLADFEKYYKGKGSSNFFNDASLDTIAGYGQGQFARYGEADGSRGSGHSVLDFDPVTLAARKHDADVIAATGKARTDATDYISSLGLDPSVYASGVGSSIDNAVAALGSTGDPSSLSGRTLAANALTDATTAARAKYGNQVSNTFGPNYGNKLISSNLLDNTVNDIINEQRGTAQTYLDAGVKRGIYNDIGAAKGQSIIDADTSSGTAQLGSLASGVIDKYRTKANTVASDAASGASGYNLGSAFNLDDYASRGASIAGDAAKYGAGDLRTALGGTNYFDLSNIGQGAGQAQGATNLRDNDLAVALGEARKKASVGRGLNSQGAF